MKIVVFGLTVSSSWGNGHATLWRGLIGALIRQGHRVVFLERDVPWYATTRDLRRLPDGAELLLYHDWQTAKRQASGHLATADAAMVTSYCPDGAAAAELVLEEAPGLKLFYDMDTPVTLARLDAGETVGYLPPQGLGDFDLVLSFTGGEALTALRRRLGARRVAPLYGHIDPFVHRPAGRVEAFRGDLSWLGTFAADRQPALQELFVEPARLRPQRRFVIGGAGYPENFPWTSNMFFVRHLPPADHPAFFCSARLTLNVTRADMAAMGYCPSGRLFEAAACGAPILSDWWPGLDSFFTPGTEIVIAGTTAEALAALELEDGALADMAAAARARVLEEHSSDRRARELTALLDDGGAAAASAARRDTATAGGLPCGA